MAVIKTKTKFTKSKFTKNKYSTKKKNVSRMTKKMNVMKGGSGVKPTRSRSRSKRLGNGSGSMRQKSPLYARVNKTRQPQYTVNRYNKIVNYMESKGKYANTRTRKDRFTENQKQQIRNLNISGKNVEQQIRNILVNSQGRSKFAPEAVRELMKQPSYLKSFVNSESQYVNIAPTSNKNSNQLKKYLKQRGIIPS